MRRWIAAALVILLAGCFGRGGFDADADMADTDLGKIGGDDAGFNTAAAAQPFDDWIEAVAVGPGGVLYVAGYFQSYGSQPVEHLARLLPTGELDTTFATAGGFDGAVTALAVTSDRDVYAAGAFGSYGGLARGRIARLESSGALDTAFAPPSVGFDDDVTCLALDAQRQAVYAGGYFTTYGGVSRVRIARLRSDGSLDTSFVTGSGFDSDVESIDVDPVSDLIYVAGWFRTYAGVGRNKLARLAANGTLDTTFTSPLQSANYVSEARYSTAAAQLFVGGDYFRVEPSGASTNFVRTAATGALIGGASSVDFDGPVYVVARDEIGGGAWIGGDFSAYGALSTPGLALLTPNGGLDESFVVGEGFAGGRVRALAPDPQRSRIYVAGTFTSYDGAPVPSLVRLRRDGTLDH